MSLAPCTLRTCSILAVVLGVAGWASPARASETQSQPPEKIFAASCSTCHGARGEGGTSWVTGMKAPTIGPLAIPADAARTIIRDGSHNNILPGYNGAMPGFGRAEITDEELDRLLVFISSTCQHGCPAPARPAGSEVTLDILDADPWFSDKGGDDAADPYDDHRRVVLTANQYLTVTNTGRTWHTMTNAAAGKDSGFIGYSGNLGAGTGYYYATQGADLEPGCHRYMCKLHPYMQFEACTAGHQPMELTRASKVPLEVPAGAGSGEIWVNVQSQEDGPQDEVDGAMQVIDSSTWSVTNYLGGVGNNPHNAWPGAGSDGGSYVLTANWHDNSVTLIDADAKTVLQTVPFGAAPAHVQVTPGAGSRWFVTVMGGSAVQEVDLMKLKAGKDPIVGVPIRGEFSPHGIWFCDDGDHFLTANTLSNTLSLYTVSGRVQQAFAGTGGTTPLASSVFGGYGVGGCARGYSNNAGTPSVSVYDINPLEGTVVRNTAVVPSHLRDDAGNLKLRDTSISPVRWVSMPIQTPVSPSDATAHGRYMVTANKASFNVSITALNAKGDPTAIYTFPAGLGAHGVTFGRKARCDDGTPVCYYAYVTNTFQDYISVYDLERVSSSGEPGTATEQVSLEGYGAQALCKQPACRVPITTVCPDCRDGAHVGDVPLEITTTGKYTFLKEHVWIDPLHAPLDLALDLTINTGAQGIVAPSRTWNTSRPAPAITGLSPVNGSSGTMVFVSGSHFDPTPGAHTVSVGGSAAPFVQAVDSTLLMFMVPPGNPAGPVTVTSSSGSATSATAFGGPPPVLSVAGIWPAKATAGSTVYVFGSGYVPGEGNTTVAINGVQAPAVQVLGDSMLSVMVPSHAKSGPMTVSTRSGPEVGAARWFDVAADDGYGGTWVKPAESTIPSTARGDLIRYGKELVTNTNHYFNVLNVRPGYKTGSDLNCTSCHMGEGTVASSSPWSVVFSKYSGKGPYFARAGRHLDTAGRIQGCLQRSMNSQSQVLPEDSREMQAMVAYFEWLSTGTKVADWTKVKGQGFPEVPLMTRAADPVRGEKVYNTYCASCHGTDGRGMTQVTGTVVPPLWGPRSFNDGAGMFRARTGVTFIRANMPLGKAVPGDTSTQLSIEDAWDVTSYVMFQERPAWHDQANDWSCTHLGPDGVPDWMRKPPDTGYGPNRPRWDGTQYTCDNAAPAVFDGNAHRYGPWQEMLNRQTQIVNDFKACGRSPCP